MKKYMPSLLSAATAVSVVLAPDIQAALAAHPVAAAVMGAMGAILCHFAPSPKA